MFLRIARGGEFSLSKMFDGQGTINIQVLTFKRLAYRLFNELGYSKTAFSKASKSMIVYYIMLKEEKNLQLLKGVQKNKGLVDTVCDIISEMKRYNVTADVIENISINNDYFKMKLHDIALIYRRLEERISSNSFDIDSRLTILSNLIPKSSMLKNSKIWIKAFR